MKHLLTMMLIACVACTSQQDKENHEHNASHQHETATTDSSLPVAAKWKADEKTKQHVNALMLIADDETYADAANRKQFYSNLQSRLDLLIQDCTMKGAEHEALHVWLEKVLDDLKLIKDEQHNYTTAHETIRKDIAVFYTSFE